MTYELFSSKWLLWMGVTWNYAHALHTLVSGDVQAVVSISCIRLYKHCMGNWCRFHMLLGRYDVVVTICNTEMHQQCIVFTLVKLLF